MVARPDDFQDPNSPPQAAPLVITQPPSPQSAQPPAQQPSPRPANPTALDLQKHIVSESTKLGMDPALGLATFGVESEFNPRATGPVTRSGERARGPAQTMPSTVAAKARGYGMDPAKVLSDPYENISFGLRYLNEHLNKYGDV